MMSRPIRRRSFLKSSSLVAGSCLAPNLLLGAEEPALKRLQVAAVGCAGKGAGDISEIAAGNEIVALCDVDHANAAETFGKYPSAKRFFDFREMLADMAEQIDVVTVSTADHMHFPIALAAMRLGKPVFVQKPLSNRISEARMLADFARKRGLLTVMGNQGATNTGTRLVREWIEAGLIGEVTEVHVWTNRPIWPQGSGLVFPEAPVPETLDWEVWQGQVEEDRPYSPKIHPFAWRGFWDYGCGALGDIGCHSMNAAFWALDLGGDFEAEAEEVSEFDDVTAPQRATIRYRFPAKGKRGPVMMLWQDGIGDVNTDKTFIRPPGIPAELELNPEFGQEFVGTEGVIHCPDAYCGRTPMLFPESLREKARTIKPVFERVKGGPTQELARAIRGEGPKPVSNFEDLAGPLTEMVLGGNLAVRLGKRIHWDSAAMKVRGQPAADAWVRRVYRKGWEPDLA